MTDTSARTEMHIQSPTPPRRKRPRALDSDDEGESKGRFRPRVLSPRVTSAAASEVRFRLHLDDIVWKRRRIIRQALHHVRKGVAEDGVDSSDALAVLCYMLLLVDGRLEEGESSSDLMARLRGIEGPKKFSLGADVVRRVLFPA